MKNVKVKTIAKLAKKQIRKTFKLSLMSQLKELAGKFGEESKKTSKMIDKGSNQLAKKLVKLVKIDKSIIIDVMKEPQVATKLETSTLADKRTKGAVKNRGNGFFSKEEVAPRKLATKAKRQLAKP